MSGYDNFARNDGSKDSTLREWSSLIGIITAIVGNVLISFALNIQRYAHLRLDRDRKKTSSRWARETGEARQQDYGTQQSNLADERARINLTAPYTDQAESGGQSTSDTRGGLNSDNTTGKKDQPISLHSRRSSQLSSEEAEKQSQEQEKKSYLKSPYWWLGLVFMVVGEAGNFLAYGFAPASTVSPLGVVALISNCIIAPCLLKERFRQRDFWGVCVAIAGAVIIVLSAKTSEIKMGPDDIWSAISRWEFETYVGITILLILILMWTSGKYGERTILIDLGLVALFGGYTALTTKGVASLLSGSLWLTLTFPITYLLVFILIFTALMQIRYINRALQHFDSTQVIPTQFVLFTISVIVGSAILYRDFKSATGDRMGKFVGGCLLTFLGVYLITSGRRGSSRYEVRGVASEPEGPIHLIDEEGFQDEVERPSHERAISRTSSKNVDSEFPDGSSSRNPSHQPLETPLIAPQLQDSKAPQSPITTSPSPPLSPENKALFSNPWQSAKDTRPLRPQQFEGTISSPVLPSQARQPLTSLEADNEASDDLDLPSTPSHAQIFQAQNRAPSLSRRSISHLTPGPYLSPLSSSLSALVADSIRRGADSPSKHRRPPLSNVHRTTSQRGDVGFGDELANAATPLRSSEALDETVDADSAADRNRRPRSLSQTLGDFFRLSRERDKGKHSQTERDDG